MRCVPVHFHRVYHVYRIYHGISVLCLLIHLYCIQQIICVVLMCIYFYMHSCMYIYMLYDVAK